jgi:hypothetical protein
VSFGDLIPDFLVQNRALDSSQTAIRYALVMENKQPFFILWNHSAYHESIQMKLKKTKLKWFKSGYIKIVVNFSTQKTTFIFTETTSSNTDVPLPIATSIDLFQQAFNLALNQKPELLKLFRDINPEIIFQVEEGEKSLKLP